MAWVKVDAATGTHFYREQTVDSVQQPVGSGHDSKQETAACSNKRQGYMRLYYRPTLKNVVVLASLTSNRD